MAQVFERNCYTKIGVGLSSTANGDSPSLLITSTNNSGDNHSHCFVGPGAGTNDDIIFCLNRNGGAYGRFDVEFNGIKRFFGMRKTPTNVELQTALREFIHRVGKGEDPKVVSEDIKKRNRAKMVPGITNFPEDGQRMMDPDTGAEAIVYPDGKIEAVK